MRRRLRQLGFTLVELLVALFAMALLATLSWRGLDGMVRVQEQTQGRADEVMTLQVGLAQWAADLEALVQMPQQTALDWNGRVLRMTRRASSGPTDGVLVVAWTQRVVDGSNRWMRWQSPPATTRGQLQEAWARAGAWSHTPSAAEQPHEVAIAPLVDWRLYYFRGGAWTNPQSSADFEGAAPGMSPPPAPAASAASAPQPTPVSAGNVVPIPDGVRLVLTLPPGHAITGELTRDWARLTQ